MKSIGSEKLMSDPDSFNADDAPAHNDENPDVHNDNQANDDVPTEPSGGAPVVAELVDDELVDVEIVSQDDVPLGHRVVNAQQHQLDHTPSMDFDRELQNLSAKGGAVGGLVLGVWSIISSLITFYGFINAALAILMGAYGLRSHHRGLAAIGIVLGICGLLLSMMEINQSISNYFLEQQEANEGF